MSNAVFGKTVENVREHRDVKLSQQKEEETIRNYLVSEPNYDTTKFLTKNLFAIE